MPRSASTARTTPATPTAAPSKYRDAAARWVAAHPLREVTPDQRAAAARALRGLFR